MSGIAEFTTPFAIDTAKETAEIETLMKQTLATRPKLPDVGLVGA